MYIFGTYILVLDSVSSSSQELFFTYQVMSWDPFLTSEGKTTTVQSQRQCISLSHKTESKL